MGNIISTWQNYKGTSFTEAFYQFIEQNHKSYAAHTVGYYVKIRLIL